MDPLTIALVAKGASKLIGAGSDIITGRKDQKEAEANILRLKGEEAALKKKRTYGVGDTWNKYLAASKQDKASDLLRQQEKQQFASNVGALKSGGAKALLGGLGAQSQQSMMQQAKIEAGAQERQMNALSTYAGVEQSAKDKNVGLAAQDLARTQGLMDNQEKARVEARNRKRQGITAGLTTGADVIGDMAEGEAKAQGLIKYGAKIHASKGAKIDRLKAREQRYQDRVKYHQEKKKAAPGIYGKRKRALEVLNEYRDRDRNLETLRASGNAPQTAQEQINAINQSPGNNSQGSSTNNGGFSGEPNLLSGNYNIQDRLKDRLIELWKTRNNNYGGKYASGGVQKTPGEFSHAKNPIDIMKDGAKIGEMTGGEYIFNPRQASTLQSLASKGGSPLHKYVRNLLKEFDRR